MPEIGLSSNHLNANLKEAEGFLRYVSDIGFDFYELEITNFSLLANQRFISARRKNFVKMLQNIPLKYSLHLPLFIDLGENNHNYIQLMETLVELGQEVEIQDFILHPTRMRSLEASQQELSALVRMTPIFKNAGIKVHIENLLNKQKHQGYNYNVDVKEVPQLLTHLDRDVYGYCFDAGHAFITTRYREEDILKEYEDVKHNVTHLHLHDNFGKVPTGDQKMSKHEATILGLGDLHLPPTWGDIPYDLMKENLKEFNGKATVEIFKDYIEDLEEILECTRDIFI